ncbi:MAG: hypothetical protein ABIF77_18895 [bacterium]
MSRIVVLLALLMVSLPGFALAATPSEQIDAAHENGQTVFILITEPGNAKTEQVRSLVQDAVVQVKRSVLVEMDRTDETNILLVRKYRARSAPVPLVLVLASNGAIAAGFQAEDLTSAAIVQSIPSPKKAEMLKELQSGRAVFITALREDMTAKAEISSACSAACGVLTDRSCSIEIDMDDPVEASFLMALGIDTQSSVPVTVVINSQGQLTASFSGAVDATTLVQAINVQRSACCPGSKTGCGPKSK